MTARRWALALLSAAVLTPALAVPMASADEDRVDIAVEIPRSAQTPVGTIAVDDAQLRWGLNPNAGSGAYAGGCNFLSAGRAGNSGGSRVWDTADASGPDALFRSAQGAVRVEKPTAKGGWEAVTWANKCQDHRGRAVTTVASDMGTGATFVFDGGTGVVDGASGTARIRWQGSATVVFYGGMTYWWLADPVLTLTPSGGHLTATVGGYGTSMEDQSRWRELAPRQVHLATFGAAELRQRGLVISPDYYRVPVSIDSSVSDPQVRQGPHWGSFPQDFVTFHAETGQSSYWHSSGGAADARKPPSPMWISYDASDVIREPPPLSEPPEELPPPSSQPGGSSSGVPDDAGSGVPAAPGPGSGGGGDIRPGTSAPGSSPGAGNLGALDAPPGARRGIVPTLAQWLSGEGLIPELVSLTDPRHRAVGALSAVFLLSSLAVVGFRRGWLTLPWTTHPPTAGPPAP
ncbi:HtaA domain-containing protein [Bogoriella caseilytica]|uniref:Htaa protein n=1 Tax=Bogoriella caseilytica TaxID=56055 RepID=A0A3N2BAJ1_9MICO|nr:HtaA domain-containing protein [Bogoriella caseilytica]ROR72293.1 Htaa protein [Bogoriella caseilytica]